MGVLTPYGTGPAPVWFHTGYITTRDFWKLGLLFGVLYLGGLLLIGFRRWRCDRSHHGRS